MGHGMNKDTNPLVFQFTFRFASNARLEPFDWNLRFPPSLELKLNSPTGILKKLFRTLGQVVPVLILMHSRHVEDDSK